MIKYIGKIILCALSLVAGTTAGGMFSTALGLEQPKIPSQVDMRVFGCYAFAAGVVAAIALAGLSRWLGGSRWTRFAAIAWFAFMWLGINNGIEAHVFTTIGGEALSAVTMLFLCLFVAGAVVLLFSGREARGSFSDNFLQFFARQTAAQWAIRLSAVVLAFPIIYFLFGMPVGLIVGQFYRNHEFGLQMPSSLSVLISVQCVRSLVALLAVWPILVVWSGSRRRFVWTFGLSLFVVAGLYGLIQAYWMPWTMRSIHSVELLLDSLAYGWLLAMLLLSRTPARPPALVEEINVRSYNT